MSKQHTWTPSTELGFMNEELNEVHSFTSDDAAPDDVVQVDSNGFLWSTKSGVAAIAVLSTDNGAFLGAYGTDANGSNFSGRRDSATTIQSGELVGTFYSLGNHVSGVDGATSVGSRVAMYATENWSASNQGSKTVLEAKPVGSTSLVECLTVDGTNVIANVPIDDAFHVVYRSVTDMEIAAGSPTSTTENARIPVYDLSSSATNSLVGSFYVPPGLRGETLKLKVTFRCPTAGSGDIRAQGFLKTFAVDGTRSTSGEMAVTDTIVAAPTNSQVHEFSGSFSSSSTHRWGYFNITRLGADGADTYASLMRVYGVYVYVDGNSP